MHIIIKFFISALRSKPRGPMAAARVAPSPQQHAFACAQIRNAKARKLVGINAEESNPLVWHVRILILFTYMTQIYLIKL